MQQTTVAQRIALISSDYTGKYQVKGEKSIYDLDDVLPELRIFDLSSLTISKAAEQSITDISKCGNVSIRDNKIAISKHILSETNKASQWLSLKTWFNLTPYIRIRPTEYIRVETPTNIGINCILWCENDALYMNDKSIFTIRSMSDTFLWVAANPVKIAYAPTDNTFYMQIVLVARSKQRKPESISLNMLFNNGNIERVWSSDTNIQESALNNNSDEMNKLLSNDKILQSVINNKLKLID